MDVCLVFETRACDKPRFPLFKASSYISLN